MDHGRVPTHNLDIKSLFSMSIRRVRAYCFTLNNYTYEEVLHLRSLVPETSDGESNEDGVAGGLEAEEEAESNSRVRFIVS